MQTSLDELASLRPCTDAEAELAGRLLRRLALAVVFGKPELFPVIAFTMVEHTLKHGVSHMSAGAFGAGAIIAIIGMQNLELASRLCHLGERHLPSAEGCMAYSIHVANMAKQYLAKPTENFFDNWTRGAEVAKREGDTAFIEYCVHVPYLSRLLAGLPPLRRPPSEHGIVDYNSRPARHILTLMYDALVCGDVATAMVHVQASIEEAPPEPQARHKYLACAAYVLLHVDNVEQALTYALQAEPFWRATVCLPDLMAMVLTICISAALLPERAAAEQAKIDAHRSRLEKWASFTPAAFRHQLLLVDAARAWTGSKYEEAEQLFLCAIKDARENGYLNNEALGQRLLGAFYEEQKKSSLAHVHLHESVETYLRWGAPTCAGAIRQRYSYYFSSAAEP
jgi:histidine kinase